MTNEEMIQAAATAVALRLNLPNARETCLAYVRMVHHRQRTVAGLVRDTIKYLNRA